VTQPAATRRGSYVAAHAYSAEAIGVAVANGVRSIEHGNLLDAPAAALMAERDAFLVPTLVTYDAVERRGAELGLATRTTGPCSRAASGWRSMAHGWCCYRGPRCAAFSRWCVGGRGGWRGGRR